MRVDLNCDMGESFGAWEKGQDAEMMAVISSANIACGWHAGDPLVMERTVRLAAEHGVGVGAHPGYPDLLGFGRRSMTLSPAETEAYVLYQISALAGIARANDVPMRHVKGHGQIYNDAVRNPALAHAIARAVYRFDSDLILVALTGSELVRAGRDLGLRVAEEAFADRVYEADGSLRSRRLPGAMIEDPARAAQQVLRMLRDGEVISYDGQRVPVHPDTICIHGDGPTAAAIGSALRQELEAAGVSIVPMFEIV